MIVIKFPSPTQLPNPVLSDTLKHACSTWAVPSLSKVEFHVIAEDTANGWLSMLLFQE